MRASTDVAIVGGGVLGTAIALHLAEAGLDVTLLERDGIGQATSAAGAGFVGMWAAGWTPTFGREHIAIERYGLDFYRELAEHEEFGYGANGNLYVATTEETWDAQIAPRLLDPDAVPSLQRLSPGEVAEITGIIPPGSVYGGILHPDGAQVSAGRATCALSRRFVIAGGRLQTRTPATGLRTRGNRVTGVETLHGSLHAERVIVAAGAWTNALLATIDVRLAIVPLVAFRVVTEPLGVPATMPTIMIGEVPMYLREYDGALLWGMHYRADPRFRFVDEVVPERFDQLPLDGLAEAEARAKKAFDGVPVARDVAKPDGRVRRTDLHARSAPVPRARARVRRAVCRDRLQRGRSDPRSRIRTTADRAAHARNDRAVLDREVRPGPLRRRVS